MAAIDHIATCGMAYRLTGDPRFAERARRDMLTGFRLLVDWHPSHFLDVAEMAWRPRDRLRLALFLPGAGRSVETIRKALVDKALVFAPAAYDPTARRTSAFSGPGAR